MFRVYQNRRDISSYFYNYMYSLISVLLIIGNQVGSRSFVTHVSIDKRKKAYLKWSLKEILFYFSVTIISKLLCPLSKSSFFHSLIASSPDPSRKGLGPRLPCICLRKQSHWCHQCVGDSALSVATFAQEKIMSG